MIDGLKTTRRAFLGEAAAAGLATGAAVAATSAQAAPADACWGGALPTKWDETYDVVVIGSGYSGLAAAWEARKAGATVAILDKMRTPGGNSILSGVIVAAAGSPLQEKQGLKDSPALMAEDMLREGLYLNHPEKVQLVAEQAWPTIKWTMEEFGVAYNDNMVHEGGHSVPRSHKPTNFGGSGAAIIQPMLAKLKSISQEVKLRTYVEKILRDKDGRVKGLQVREGYVFPRADSGKQKFIRAKKAVVLAHGGFGQDVAFRMIQDPKLTSKFDCTNHPGATSELLRETLRLGATPVHLSWIQVGPWASPDEKGFGLGPLFAQAVAAMHGVWVNTTTGKRFINELANRKIRADAIMLLMNQGHNCIAIGDAANIPAERKEMLAKALERGVVKPYNSIEEAAAAYNVPVEPFKKTIADYNRYLEQGKDEEFGRYQNKLSKPLGQTFPLYVQRLLPKVHYTMGGIGTDNEARVLDISTGKAIPGLYAAGESVGGVHGAVRLGSCSSITCLIYGRIAGRNAAADKAWS